MSKELGVPVPVNLQEHTSPGIRSHMIIKYIVTLSTMITTEETSWALINKLVYSSQLLSIKIWTNSPISSAGVYFYLNNNSTKVLDSKIPLCLQEFLHVAHCIQVLRNHLHNFDFMAYTEWLFQVIKIGTAEWVEDSELKWTDVPDVKDICRSGVLFLWRLNIMLQVMESHQLQSEHKQHLGKQAPNTGTNHQIIFKMTHCSLLKQSWLWKIQSRAAQNPCKLPLTSTEVASVQLVFSTSQPCA